jgi:hypothetical protein
MPKLNDFEVTPGEGWGPFKLGETRSNIAALLKSQGIEFEGDDDAGLAGLRSWDPHVLFVFDGMGSDARLIHIGVETDDITINQQAPSKSLDEMLVAFGVQSFADTNWREHHPEDEFDVEENPDAVRDDEDLLDYGTLWLAKQGIGLAMLSGVVDEIAIRPPDQVPQNGFGPLSEQQLERVLTLKERIEEESAPKEYKPGLLAPYMPYVRPFVNWGCGLAIAAVIGLCAYTQYRWQNSTSVEGTLVAKLPPGADFPDEYVYEYTTSDDVKRTVNIGFQYANVRNIGEKMELRYLAEAPERAITVSQSHDEGFFEYIWYLFPCAILWIIFSVIDAAFGR